MCDGHGVDFTSLQAKCGLSEKGVDKTPGLRGGCDLSVVLCRPTVHEHGQNRVKSYTGFFVNVYYEHRACPSQNFKVFLLTGG